MNQNYHANHLRFNEILLLELKISIIQIDNFLHYLMDLHQYYLNYSTKLIKFTKISDSSSVNYVSSSVNYVSS